MMKPRTAMLLDELDNSIAMGKRVPLSSMVMIDKEHCRQMVMDIRNELPADITAAESILQNQSSIISEARDIAEQTKAEANMRASRAVNDANAQAQSTLNMAAQKAQEMMHKAQEQAQMMLSRRQGERPCRWCSDAEERAAKQLVSEQEIITRARMEVVEIRQSTQEEIDKLYHDVYKHIDDVLGPVGPLHQRKADGHPHDAPADRPEHITPLICSSGCKVMSELSVSPRLMHFAAGASRRCPPRLHMPIFWIQVSFP